MKKLLSKVFFASDGAKGMLFALTLVTFGNYLWLSFFMMLSLCLGDIYRGTMLTFAVVTTLTTLYALATMVCAVTHLVKILRVECRFKALWYLLPAGVCLAVGAVGFVGMFPPYALSRWCATAGLCGFGFGVGKGLPGVAPEYWAAVFLLSLVLIFASGLLLTKAFAAAEKKKLRSAFGAATLTLYGVLIVWHLVTLGLAFHASRETAAVSAAVQRRFGRPLTAAGIEALYRENGRADAAFWERWRKLRADIPKVAAVCKSSGERTEKNISVDEIHLPDRPSAETLAWYDRCTGNRAAIEKYESCFDRVPPLPEKRFIPGNLYAVELPELRWCRTFVVLLLRSSLIRALAAGDADGAWKCYLRMGNVGALLEKEPFLICSLVWIAIGDMRMDCAEKLLESRLLPDDKLTKLEADLAALEQAMPGNHRQAMYSEAAFAADSILGLEEGRSDLRELAGGDDGRGTRRAALAPYRWIFPQYWFHAELDKKNLLRIYLLPDLARAETLVGNRLFFMSMMLTPALDLIGNRFFAFTARVRGMRVLIRAENYRRKHGEFPKTLADLPLDPFSGKPLVYEVGKAEVLETVWENPVEVIEKTVKTTVDAVSVRSPKEGLSKPSAIPKRALTAPAP